MEDEQNFGSRTWNGEDDMILAPGGNVRWEKVSKVESEIETQQSSAL